MENINNKLKVTLIESTLLEDNQSKFKNMIDGIKKWMKDVKEKLSQQIKKVDKIIKDKVSKLKPAPKDQNITERQASQLDPVDKYLKKFINNYTTLTKEMHNHFLTGYDYKGDGDDPSEIGDKVQKVIKDFEDFKRDIRQTKGRDDYYEFRNTAVNNLFYATFSLRTSIFMQYTKAVKTVMKDISYAIRAVKMNIEACNKMVMEAESGKENDNGQKIPFSKKFRMYSKVVGATMRRIGQDLMVIVNLTTLCISLSIFKAAAIVTIPVHKAKDAVVDKMKKSK